MSSLFPKKNPAKETSWLRNPTAEFALTNRMITKDEWEEVANGHSVIEGHTIMHTNHPDFPGGSKHTLYQGRADEIEIKRLLGEPLFDED